MRIGSIKGGMLVDGNGVRHEIQEIKYRGKILYPIYRVELSVSSLFIPASGGESTIHVYGVRENEEGYVISRVELAHRDVTIVRSGDTNIYNNMFTFMAESRGTSIGDERTATYTISWKGASATLVVRQEANSETLSSVTRKFVFNNEEYEVGDSISVDSSALVASLSCYYTNHYTYTSNAEKDVSLNGAIYRVQGTGFTYANNTLTISENTGASERQATIIGRFPLPSDEYSIVITQAKPAVVVYDVRWTFATLEQVGGKKAFRFGITYNSNMTGATGIEFVAYKMNNGVRTNIAYLRGITLTGTSYTYSGSDFANNDSTLSGDQYYIGFSYSGQTFASQELENEAYLENPRLVYSSGTIINAKGSNYAYAIADLARGGTVTSRDVVCTIKTIDTTALTITNGRVYGANKGTTTSNVINGTITSISYLSYTLSVGLYVSQEANVVTSIAHSYDYVIMGLTSPFPSNDQAPSTGATKGISYTSCARYDTPTYTYTSTESAVQSRRFDSSITPTYNNTASWITMSSSNVVVAQQAKNGTARSATITLLYGSVKLGEVTIYQKATTKTYGLNVSSNISSVGAGGGSATLTASGVTAYDNGMSADYTTISSGWSCTNSGSLVSGKWSVSGVTATAQSLRTTTTTGSNNGTFSLTWNGITKTITIGQSANTRTEGALIGSIDMDGNVYTSSQSVNVTNASHSYALLGMASRTYTYTSGETSYTPVTPSLQVSGLGFSISASTLKITENSSTNTREGILELIYNGSTIIMLTITQAAYVPVDWLTMSATYSQRGGRKTFDISVNYSTSLRSKTILFQVYKLNGGVRTDIGAGTRVTMPSTGNDTSVSIVVTSTTMYGDTFRVEASYGRVLDDVEATMA